ncbi:MAG: gliding motility-associated C-terminal domain-containing protein [Bacteroidota bacterium]
MKMQLLKFLKVTTQSNLSKHSFKFLSIPVVLLALTLTSGLSVKAQFTATWPLLAASQKTPTVTDVQASSVIAGDMIPGTNFASGTHNTDGFKCQLTTVWPTVPTDGDNLDFPLSPAAGFDMTITGLTLVAKTSSSSGANVLQLAYQADGAGPWILFGSPQNANSGGTNTLNFGALNQTFFNGHTYLIRLYAYAAGSGTNSGRQLYIKNVTFTGSAALAGTPPSVTTDAVGSVTYTTAITTGTITAGTIPVLSSGVTWSTSPNPTAVAPNYTTNGPTGAGAIGDGTGGNITGLSVNTTYYVRAYVTSLAGTTYGTELSFTTPLPDYKLTSNTGALDFGAIPINTSSILSYSVSGKLLSPASGEITVTAPVDFTVSTSASGPFTNSIQLPYTGSTLAPTTVYVKFTPTGAFTTSSGTITLSGGGVVINEEIINETVKGSGKLVDPATTSNVGNEFWVGYGYQSLMTGSNNQDMVLYLSAKQSDSIIVEIPLLGYREAYWVEGGVALQTNALPKSGLLDARLFQTGISPKAIHVYSKQGKLFAVWAHIYASQSAGATLVLPTNTWSTDYTVLTTGGTSNSDFPHSFFFVIANDDETRVEITPSADITASAEGTSVLYPAGVPFIITLNKGEVFNALGTLFATRSGNDLTGTKIKSLDCSKKIAVFNGNGRVILRSDVCSGASQGSDNFLQQIFPKVAWGTKYLTSPLTGIENSLYRIVVQDPLTTDVTVNGTLLDKSLLLPASATEKFYYEYPTNATLSITSNKPVMVAQFALSNPCNDSKGDPEMIILSPTAQAIKEVTVYSAINYSIDINYINAIVKKTAGGTVNFSLDGVDVSSQFTAHPGDNDYAYASFEVTGGISHNLLSTESFNAIAYGYKTSNHESYGYNAGTAVNDLTAPLILNNPYGDSLNSLNTSKPLTTCKGTDVTLSATLPFANAEGHPIVFSYGANANISPNTDDIIANPVLSHTFVFGGQTFYVYKLTQKHTFTANGDYQINVTYFNPNSDGCGGQEGSNKTISYTIKVIDGVDAVFAFDNYNVCVSTQLKLLDQSTSDNTNAPINQWKWTYDNGTKVLPNGQDIVKNPVLASAPTPANNIKLVVINSIGCYDSVQNNYPVQTNPEIVFNNEFATLCSNGNPVALNQATPAGGSYSGTGVINNNGVYTFDPKATGVLTNAPNVITYSLTSGTCTTTGTNSINVVAVPVVVINGGRDTSVVINDPITITATSSVPNAIFEWSPSTGLTPTNALVTQAQLSELGAKTYTLTATNGTCSGSDAIILTVRPDLACLDPMKGFTPNNDNINDRWRVYNDEGCYDKVQVDVYNRWGGLVYHSDDYKNNWIGEYKGKPVPDATYYYVVKAKDSNGKTFTRTGNVTIIR